MKRLFCLILSILIAASLTVLPAGAADSGKLTITDNGVVIAEVEVGSVFIYHVGLNTAGHMITSGEGELRFDSGYVAPVAYGPVRKDGSVDRSAYSFAPRVYSTSLVVNYDITDRVYYNFARYAGIDAFDDGNENYFKIRFQALKPGRTEIHHYIKNMADQTGGDTIRLFRQDRPNQQLDPMPYTLTSVETAAGYIGDADGDCSISVPDATFIQMLTAGKPMAYQLTSADANADGSVDLRDALAVLRYKAGIATNTAIGEWVFLTEQ